MTASFISAFHHDSPTNLPMPGISTGRAIEALANPRRIRPPLVVTVGHGGPHRAARSPRPTPPNPDCRGKSEQAALGVRRIAECASGSCACHRRRMVSATTGAQAATDPDRPREGRFGIPVTVPTAGPRCIAA